MRQGENEVIWIPEDQLKPTMVPEELLSWLLERQSMTARLKFVSGGAFRVCFRQQEWTYLQPTEVAYLGIPAEEMALVREVDLLCFDKPWIFGRTAFSRALTEAKKGIFETLGTKPLGEVLFQDPTLVRSTFEIAELNATHLEYQKASAGFISKPQSLWARRSIFRIAAQPLLLTEVFLPEIAHANRAHA